MEVKTILFVELKTSKLDFWQDFVAELTGEFIKMHYVYEAKIKNAVRCNSYYVN
jgi:hypothetical protein|tara:strand:+ start:199 stop:360 length:162 start_codon:yes stop_codon:yes gene_type:complete